MQDAFACCAVLTRATPPRPLFRHLLLHDSLLSQPPPPVTNTIVQIASGSGNKASLVWRRAFYAITLANLYSNLINPVLELEMVTPDDLLAPHFGNPGAFNFLGVASAYMRAFRFILIMTMCLVYMSACNIYLWRLRRTFAMTAKSSTGKLARTSMKILMKMTRYQIWTSLCVRVIGDPLDFLDPPTHARKQNTSRGTDFLRSRVLTDTLISLDSTHTAAARAPPGRRRGTFLARPGHLP